MDASELRFKRETQLVLIWKFRAVDPPRLPSDLRSGGPATRNSLNYLILQGIEKDLRRDDQHPKIFFRGLHDLNEEQTMERSSSDQAQCHGIRRRCKP